VVLPIEEQGVPTRTWQPPAGRGRGGADAQAPPAPPAQQVPTLFSSATRDTKTGAIYLKVVNRAAAPQSVRIEIHGVTTVEPKGKLVTMAASSPDDTNSITAMTRIVPVESAADGFATSFTRTFPPYSISVVQLSAR
jgi:alpha-N-arabinofuranosidase